MRILITGGTGLIGSALCNKLISQNHEVYVLSRNPQLVANKCAGAKGIGKLEELESAGYISVIINLAGAPIADRRWSARRRELLWESRISLTQMLVKWLELQPKRPALILSASATGWYGDAGDRILDEYSKPGKIDFGAILCDEWERTASLARSTKTRVIILRIAPVLASNAGMLAKLRLPYLLGLGCRLGDGKQWMPWIHLHDLIELLEKLILDPYCEGTYNACAPEVVRQEHFAKSLASILGRWVLLTVPASLLRILFGQMSTILLSSQLVRPKRMLETGFTFKYPTLNSALASVMVGVERISK